MILPLSHALYRAVHLTPNVAVVYFTLGVVLMYVELNRPGVILPGCFGLLACLFAVGSLVRFPLSPMGVLVFVSGAALLLLDLIRPLPLAVSITATLALVLGLFGLVAGPPTLQIRAVTAILCGLFLGAGTSVLTRIARRARANKAVD
jgi:membrane-bound serine protease (ClpP class)